MSFFGAPSMDKIGSRLASFVSSASEKVKEAAERTLTKETPLEKNLREAVSDKNWGCATSVLSEIARASHNYGDYALISKAMWDAIGEPPKRWKRIFKGLTMLEYMLKNGVDKFAEEARDKSYLLRMLQNFNWAEEGRDKGAGIREKAELCTTLVFDAGELKAAREKAALNRDKFIGISSASSMAYRSSSSSSSSSRMATAGSGGMGSAVRHPTPGEGTSKQTAAVKSTTCVPEHLTNRLQCLQMRTDACRSEEELLLLLPSVFGGYPQYPAAAAAAGVYRGEVDLLGFNSPSGGPQASTAFGAGNDWADFSAAEDSSSSFLAFVPPPPPPAAAASSAAAAAAAAVAIAEGASDDIFGGFQAATPPSAGGAPSSTNALDAPRNTQPRQPVMQLSHQQQQQWRAVIASTGGCMHTCAAAAAAVEVRSMTASVSPATAFSPSAKQQTSPAGPFGAAAPQSFQWQQQHGAAAASNNTTSSSSSGVPQQLFTLGNRSSSAMQQPFTLSSSSCNAAQHQPLQQQPFVLASSNPVQQQQQQQQQQPMFKSSGSQAAQPFTLNGGFSAPWQQQQQQQSAAAAASPSANQSLF
ncbi:hypothetical protein Esti_001234 [Eimeria stiedai]